LADIPIRPLDFAIVIAAGILKRLELIELAVLQPFQRFPIPDDEVSGVR
jgi:hypothetical protein